MEKREQQAHRERLDVLRRELAHGVAYAASSRARNTLPRKSTRSFTSPVRRCRHQRRRLVVHDVEDRRAVGTRLLANGIDAANPLRHQQAGGGALAFEQRVGPDRGAVAEIADVGSSNAGCEQRLDPGEDRARGSSGVEGPWRSIFAGRFVEVDEIGKVLRYRR
jgi:hypothetical protein